MALVGLSIQQSQQVLVGYENRLSVAVSNSPTSTVLSGDADALEEALAALEQKGVFCRPLPAVDLAAHSPHMEPLKHEIVRKLEGLQPRPASVPMYSTVTGKPIDGLALDAHYWGRNLRQPVLFSSALEQLLADGHDVFVEIHPHVVLMRSIQENLKHANCEGAVISSLKRGEEGQVAMLGSLGALHTLGYPVDWNQLYRSGGRCVRLPSYPWQRQRYWMEPAPADIGQPQRRSHTDRSGSSLAGRRFSSALHAGTQFWELDLGTDLFPYLGDHRVQGLIVLPAAAYVDIVLSAAENAFGPGCHALEKVNFKRALVLPETGTRLAQLVFSSTMPGEASFQFYSRQEAAAEQPDAWTLHATGTVRLGQSDQQATPERYATPDEIQARCPDQIAGAEHYKIMMARGLQYGPEFQGIDQIWRRDGESLAHIRLSETVASEAHSHQVHPALLDACFQALAAAVPRAAAGDGADGDSYLPVKLKRIRVLGQPDAELWSHTRLRQDGDWSDDVLEGDVELLDDEGHVVLEASGLSVQRLGQDSQHVTSGDLDNWLYEVRWQPRAHPETSPTADLSPTSTPGSWLILADNDGVGKALASRLAKRGERCVVALPGKTYRRTYKRAARETYRINPGQAEDMRQLLVAAFGSDQPALRGVIHLWGLDIPAFDESAPAMPETAQRMGPISILHLVQALATAEARGARLWLVTRGCQALGAEGEPLSIGQSPVWGLGKVIAFEHPELSCTRIDLDSTSVSRQAGSLHRELWLNEGEDQVALRGETRYVARLERYAPQVAEEEMSVIRGDDPYRLEASPSGILDNMKLRATLRQKPGPGQVEIQVDAAGLNFLDVLSALGMRPDQPKGSTMLGMECAGRVASTGAGVEDLQVGDEVVAIAPASFSRYVMTTAPFAVPKPARLSFEEAATIPVAFLTAYYALHHLGRMAKGERVLIHAAAGGVGLAAVRLAQRDGAEIFATAGSQEKREFLRSLGVEHIMNSRTLDFADEVMERTNGEGVDLVLNSLAGEFIPKSLETLRANGRFLEIGKRDIYQNSQLGMGHLRNNLSFFAVDLIPMFVNRPDFCGAMLHELVALFEDGSLELLPFKVFTISEAENAFRYMAQAKHIGKIVLSMQEDVVSVAPASGETTQFRPDGAYLITGGLGGLGLSVAQWMVQRGVQHVALMGRSDASAAAQGAIDAMKQAGIHVEILKADVTQAGQIANALATVRECMPPLRGVVHAAGVLDDGILLHLNEERFRTVLAPKVDGAWHLHALTLDDALDHFILFSSAASVLGSPGQGNYVAANAFLDALAHYRRSRGQPALAINWGPWAEVGLAARVDRARHVTQQGLVPFSPAQGVQLMERILHHNPVQVMGLAVEWGKLPAGLSTPLLSSLAKDAAQQTGPAKSKKREGELTREKLLSVEPAARQQLVETFLQAQVARVLRTSPSKIDVRQRLDQLGIDSLMGFELINRLEAELEMSIPMAVLLQGPSLAQLTTQLLAQLTPSIAEPAVPPETGPEIEEEIPAQVDQLSDEQVDVMLREMLETEGDESQIPEREIAG